MRLGAALTPLFAYPVADILAQLPGEADPLWDVSKMRQERYRTHRTTRSIIFKWLENLTPQQPQPVMTAAHLPAPLFAAVSRCGGALESHFGGTIVRLLLVELAAGATIPAHQDKGALLEQTHRCHVAIATNPSVRFTIGDETFHMEEGMAYEMDNMRVHAAENAGPTRRVHLICNILPPQDA
jgi:quercetin dioxygenase-like cupin family protein